MNRDVSQIKPVNVPWESGHILRWHDAPITEGAPEGGYGSFFFCITLYNEDPALLCNTLHAIAANLMQLAAMGHAPEVLIFVLADGFDCIHADTLGFFQTLGFAFDAPARIHRLDDDRVLWLQHRTIPLHCFGARQEQQPAWSGLADLNVRLMLGIKAHNAGKLDSHAWLFCKILPSVSVRYVIQLDAGSKPLPNCLYQLCSEMACRPRCAAVAPNISADTPSAWGDMLQTWQYFDFLIDKIVNYPLRSFVGHLELLPGQCTLFRRMALVGETENGQGLTRYLSGLHVAGWLAKNAFLTEDRMIPHDLSLGGGQAVKLHYATCADAQTDLCQTPAELLRQRRRWLNGALACRFYAIRYIPSYVRAHGLPWRTRLIVPLFIIKAALYEIALMLYPALLALSASYAALIVGSLAGTPWKKAVALGGALCLLAQWLWVMHQSQHKPDRMMRRHGLHRALILLSVTLSTVFVVLLLAATHAIQLMAGVALGIALLTIVSMKGWKHLHVVPFACVYLPTCLAINLSLITYAMVNLSNLSWGTKGLVQAAHGTVPARQRALDYAMLGWKSLTVAAALWAAVHAEVLSEIIYFVMSAAFLNIIFGCSCLLGAWWIARMRARNY